MDWRLIIVAALKSVAKVFLILCKIFIFIFIIFFLKQKQLNF